jgi:putative nucleotidyltransferase with HDIG domain
MTPHPSVLIVDDEPAVRDLMARWVSSLGFSPCTAANTDEALATLDAQPYELAVIDVMMPGRDGVWLATHLHRQHPQTAVVLATAYTDLFDADAKEPPIADLLIKPFQRDRFALAVDRGRQWRKHFLEETRWQQQLSTEMRERTDAVRVHLRERADATNEADALSAIGMSYVPDVMEHSQRVARYARSVARELALPKVAEDLCAESAVFHDIGKAAMPQALLTKPSPLTPTERTLMRQHVNVGAEILSSSRTLWEAAPIVLATHEWFSGGGYPRQLAGPDIPLESRVITVVDAYDAMTQDRVYRRGMDVSEAMDELSRCRGSQFDPKVVDAFIALLKRH